MNRPIDNIIRFFSQHIQRAIVSTKLQGGHNFCPACKKRYLPTYSSKTEAMDTDNLVAREQWLTGICSSKCWDKFLAPATN